MPTVIADYQDRKRIVFSARERSQINVRTPREDGPVGFTSSELLLSALANCSLGTLLNHPLLIDKVVHRCEAMLHAEMQENPAKMASIFMVIDLVVEDEALLAYREELEFAACTCPMCNTISPGAPIRVELRMRVGTTEEVPA